MSFCLFRLCDDDSLFDAISICLIWLHFMLVVVNWNMVTIELENKENTKIPLLMCVLSDVLARVADGWLIDGALFHHMDYMI
jgi:hypothetical protein